MHKIIFTAIFLLFFSYFKVEASDSQTHLKKVSKRLFFIKPISHDLTSTQLFKDLEKQITLTPHASDESLQEICKFLKIVENVRITHSLFLALLPNPHRTRSQKAIALINNYPFDLHNERCKKETFLALAQQFEDRYPKKFNKSEQLMMDTGFDEAQELLTKHIEELPRTSPNACHIIKNVLNQNKICTLGQLLQYAVP